MTTQTIKLDEGRKLVRARHALMSRLRRVSLELALAHFLAIPLLYWSFEGKLSFYGWALTAGGLSLLSSYYLTNRGARYVYPVTLFLLTLLFEICFVILRERHPFHPVSMLIPLIGALITPVVGNRAAAVCAVVGGLTVGGLALHLSWQAHTSLLTTGSAIFLFYLVLAISMYLSHALWREMIETERKLNRALLEGEQKSIQMQNWIEQMGRASALISGGNLHAPIPKAPADKVYGELTRSLGEVQDKLANYFHSLMTKERLNSLGSLAYGIAHELNTPLTTLAFIIDSQDSLSPEIKQKLSYEIERMGKIARGLLTFAQPSEMGRLDLNDLLGSCDGLLRNTIPKEVVFELKLSQGPLWINGVSSEILQVLINTIHNSVDALKDCPLPMIQVSTLQTNHGTAILEILDTGPGMNPETLARIVDPFFTTKPVGEGTGLGLFIVHEIARAMSGTLQIESSLGKGTRVRLEIPLLTEQMSEAA